MKLQDQNLFGETLFGLMGFYHSSDERGHVINSENIQTREKIIIKGQDYLIASTLISNSKPIVHQITILDAQHLDGNVYLFVTDKITSRVYVVNVCLECPNNKCPWVIFEANDKKRLLDYLAVKSYCQESNCSKDNCHNSVEDHPQYIQDDLLEFDF